MPETLHASAVAYGDVGLLIIGPSGSGKSSLALELMALGCDLVSDDRCEYLVRHDSLFVMPPDAIAGQIEARGLGILNAEYRSEIEIKAVVDLGQAETERLPEVVTTEIAGAILTVLRKNEIVSFPAQLLQYLKGSRRV